MDFTENLKKTLERIRVLTVQLDDVQDALVHGRTRDALNQYLEADTVLINIGSNENTNAVDLLRQRALKLKDKLVQENERYWKALVHFDYARSWIEIFQRVQFDSEASEIDIESIVDMSSKLGLLDSSIVRLCRELDNIIFKPCLLVGSDSKTTNIVTEGSALYVTKIQTIKGPASIMNDITTIVRFLNQHLPSSISTAMSQILMPSITSRMISNWLAPSVPISLEAMRDFQILLRQVLTFSGDLVAMGWDGSAELTEWVRKGPLTWLAKQRESSLASAKVLLSRRIRETKVVERVETQTIPHGEGMAPKDSSTDDWDAGWTDEESRHAAPGPLPEDVDRENGTNTWDTNGKRMDSGKRTLAPKENQPQEDKHGKEDDEDAWGWNNQDVASVSSSPVRNRKEAHQANGHQISHDPNGRELTLKEAYTVTAIPDDLRDLIIQTARDAEALRQPAYASSSIVPVATGLYSLPTLMLAGYRALAPYYYSSLTGGNMFLYNDSMRLAETLQTFDTDQTITDASSSQPKSAWPSTRMKLPADISALESFGKRAYGKEMESQRTILRDLLDGAQGFANCTEPPFAAECENAVTMTVDRLREVAKQWTGILSRSALLQSLGSLLSTVLTKLIGDVEDMSDIGEEESKRLKRFCDEIAKLSELFMQDDRSAVQDGREQGKDMTGVYTPNWFKFVYLAELLESSLADIKYLWQEGELKLEFQVGEVVDLVEALFADSEYRRKAIAEIRKG